MLTAGDFAAFHRWVHDREPLPWQEELVSRLLSGAGWPDRIEVPPGAGRRLLTLVAVFVAAARPRVERPAAVRRILLITDRLLVLDAAWEQARRLGRRLELAHREGTGGVVGRVIDGLLPASSGASAGRPLTVARMHPGPTQAGAWLDRPDGVRLVFATADQVGSRFLFRGYGIDDRRRPVEAAGVGVDALWLLEDVADTDLLAATVAAATTRDRRDGDLPFGDLPFGDLPFGDLPLHPPVLVALHGRTGPSEPATATLTVPPDQVERTLAEQAIRRAGPPASAVLLICNTVDRARAVHRLLTAARSAGDVAHLDPWLLTARARPVDLEPVAAAVRGRFRPGREHPPGARPVVLVTSQLAEVGAELSADAVVTEAAPGDVLGLRLAALARAGHEVTPERAVVVDPTPGPGFPYSPGPSPGPSARASAGASDTSARSAPPHATRAPLLLGPTLDLWASTAPVPVPDPPVQPFLHGFDARPAAVAVAWRDGLLAADGSPVPWPVLDLPLRVFPVQPEEQVQVPLDVVQQWLSGLATDPVCDLEHDPRPRSAPSPDHPDGSPRRVLTLRSPAPGRRPPCWEWVPPGQLTPGEAVLVPAEYGGLDEHGWNPRSMRPVPDAAELSALRRGRPALRLDTGLARRLRLTGARAAALGEVIADLDDAVRAGEPPEHEPGETAAAVAELLGGGGSRFAERNPHRGTRAEERESGWSPARRAALLGWLAGVPRPVVVAGSAAEGTAPALFLVGGTPRPLPPPEPGLGAGTELRRPVTLVAYQQAVAERTGQLAAELGLPPRVARTLADAARWHDLGLAQSRFQQELRERDPWTALTTDEDLSPAVAMGLGSGLGDGRAEPTDGPGGLPHEVWSVSLVREWLAAAPHPYPGDADLLVQLVAAHHGHARPWFPPVVDAAAPELRVELDGTPVTVRPTSSVLPDHPGRFGRLNDRYGRWGLALLETVLRCADDETRTARR